MSVILVRVHTTLSLLDEVVMRVSNGTDWDYIAVYVARVESASSSAPDRSCCLDYMSVRHLAIFC